MKKQLLLLFSLVVMFFQAQAIDLFGTYQKALAYNADYLRPYFLLKRSTRPSA